MRGEQRQPLQGLLKDTLGLPCQTAAAQTCFWCREGFAMRQGFWGELTWVWEKAGERTKGWGFNSRAPRNSK